MKTRTVVMELEHRNHLIVVERMSGSIVARVLSDKKITERNKTGEVFAQVCASTTDATAIGKAFITGYWIAKGEKNGQ